MEKRLYRSRKEKILGGVCGGVAEYLGVDVTLIRVIWILMVLLGGPGLIAYIVCWLIIPEEPKGRRHGTNKLPANREAQVQTGDAQGVEEGKDAPAEVEGPGEAGEKGGQATGEGARRTLGLILIVVGFFFLLRQLGGWAILFFPRLMPGLDWARIWGLSRALFWPLVLVILGVILIIGSLGRRQE